MNATLFVPRVSPGFSRTTCSIVPGRIQLVRDNEIRISSLESQLREIESRLGTFAERDSDFSECRELAHTLASLYCVSSLVEFLDSDEDGPPFEHGFAV